MLSFFAQRDPSPAHTRALPPFWMAAQGLLTIDYYLLTIHVTVRHVIILRTVGSFARTCPRTTTAQDDGTRFNDN